MHGAKPHAASYLHKQRTIVEIHGLLRACLRHVDRHLKDVRVRLTKVNEAGRHEEVHKIREPELANAILGELATLITHNRQLQLVSLLGLPDELDHFRIRLRSLEHERLEIVSGKIARLVEADAV